jgi:hypothetical protein
VPVVSEWARPPAHVLRSRLVVVRGPWVPYPLAALPCPALPVSTARGLNLNLHLTPHYLCVRLPNVSFVLLHLHFARRCVLSLHPQSPNVFRGLAVPGSRNVETADWNRPPAGPPRVQRAARGHELQELPQAKGGDSCLSLREPPANLTFQDQVQPHTPNLRGVSGVQLSVYLRYASSWPACPVLT